MNEVNRIPAKIAVVRVRVGVRMRSFAEEGNSLIHDFEDCEYSLLGCVVYKLET